MTKIHATAKKKGERSLKRMMDVLEPFLPKRVPAPKRRAMEWQTSDNVPVNGTKKDAETKQPHSKHREN